jgi:hypothetical protein
MLLAIALIAQAVSWPGGSWMESCVGQSMNGAIFSAVCKTQAAGPYKTSSINLNRCPTRTVGNNNGMLFCETTPAKVTPLPAGSWRVSCTNGLMKGTVLHAQCTTGSGYSRSSALDMHTCPSGKAGNTDGVLYCEQ